MTINHSGIASKLTLLGLGRGICLLSVMMVLWLCAAPSAKAETYYYRADNSSMYEASTPLQACVKWGAYYTSYYSSPTILPYNTNSNPYYKCVNSSGVVMAYIYRYGDSCPTGATYNASNGTCTAPSDPPMDANSSCLGYTNTAHLAAADDWTKEPRTIAYNIAGMNGVARITGARKTPTSKPYSYYVDCYGKKRTSADANENVLPKPTPSPPPPVDTAYPKCGVGNYLYTDEAGVSMCSQNLPDRTLTDCQSGNGGYVNDKAVCLPPNPAPTVAANAATTAQQKADAAVTAGRGTSAAVAAANDAATAYKRAAEASNSMPSNTQASSSAAQAYQSAVQAAIAAGMSVPAPLPNPGTATGTGTGGNGTGDQNTGPKECGSPGKPKCAIDETGTPTAQEGKATMDAIAKTTTDNMDTRTTRIEAEVGGTQTEATRKVVSWDFSFSFPTGCTAYDMFLNVKLDFCRFQPMIHELMSLVWIGATIFACMSMVAGALRNSNA